jgi:nicotinamide-nucleotide adenylyltransferase
MEKKAAVFIGRFQPLHKGHLFAIKKIAKRHKALYIVIGSAQKKNEPENPFSLRQRKKMLLLELQPIAQKMKAKFQIFALNDNPSNARWLDDFFKAVPKFGVAYSNNPLVRKLLRSRGVVVRGTGSQKRSIYQGKRIRGKMLAGKKWQDCIPEKIVAYVRMEAR